MGGPSSLVRGVKQVGAGRSPCPGARGSWVPWPMGPSTHRRGEPRVMWTCTDRPGWPSTESPGPSFLCLKQGVCVCEKTLPLQAILRSLVQQEAQKSLGSRLAECSLVCHRGGALWTPDRGSVEQRPGGPLPVPQPLPPGSLNHNAFISH